MAAISCMGSEKFGFRQSKVYILKNDECGIILHKCVWGGGRLEN